MKLKKSDGGGGGANWMDTYGDMVTLLLCFFVLLYSMSNVDQNKWRALVQSFNPNAVIDEQPTPGGPGGIAEPVPPEVSQDPDKPSLEELEMQAAQDEVDAALEMLYQQMRQYVQDSGKNIEVTKGDGVVYVNFDDTVFFEGEEYDIKPEGKETLKVVCDVLAQAEPYIDEVRIMGHTAQANFDRPNYTRTDRMLASNRATETAIFIQENCGVLDPARIISEGYGQWRPLVPNNSVENQAKNRRVEMMVSGKDMFHQIGDSIKQYNHITGGGITESEAEPESSAPQSSAEGQVD